MAEPIQQITEVKKEETSLYLLTKAEIDTQIATAKAFPRSVTLFQQKALSMATLTEDIAASCTYALPRAGKSIEGKSVRLAEIAVAAYQNIHAGARVISDDGKFITAQGVCWDLENNTRITKEVMRKVTDKNGRRYSDDMITTTSNAACSIALRNAVFSTIPSALTDSVYEKAKEVARGTAETLLSRRGKALEYFKGIGVTEKQICDVLEIKKVEDVDLDKLQILTGMKAAIKNGESTIKEIFEPENGMINPDDLQLLYDIKKEVLTGDEQINAERILKNKETASYKKLQTLLQSK